MFPYLYILLCVLRGLPIALAILGSSECLPYEVFDDSLAFIQSLSPHSSWSYTLTPIQNRPRVPDGSGYGRGAILLFAFAAVLDEGKRINWECNQPGDQPGDQPELEIFDPQLRGFAVQFGVLAWLVSACLMQTR